MTITRGSQTTPTLGDVDGDGDLDLMIGEASGVLNFYRNDGTRSAPTFTLVSDEFQAIDVGRRSAPAFADLDGDGDLDLLVGSDDQGLTLFANQGTTSEARWVRDESFKPGDASTGHGARGRATSTATADSRSWWEIPAAGWCF